MSLPMLMGSYSTKHLLKIITGVVLVIAVTHRSELLAGR